MSNHYCRASFSILVSAAEAALMDEILTLDLSGLTPSELDGFFQLRSLEFRETFPGTAEDSFAGFRKLFSDPQDLDPSFTMNLEQAACGGIVLGIYGNNVDVETLANMLAAVCRSAQPCGFAYSYGCSKLRAGEFGGGYVVISGGKPVFHDTDTDLQCALAQLQPDEAARPLAMAKRDAENGSPTEAAEYNLPIAHGEPEWLTTPIIR